MKTSRLAPLKQRTATWTTASISVATLCLGLASTHVIAESHTDYARVTHVSPIYETISVEEPHRECHIEERAVRHYKQSASATPTIIGALVGGALGNRLGHNKSNKRVGAVAGAILGGSIANDLSRNKGHHGTRTKSEKVCNTHYTTRYEKQVSAYDVSYEYRGREYNTIMDNHPDRRIQVAVDVRPIDY